MTLRTLLATLLLCLCLPLQAATEVIPLNYRTADEVLGVVQSMLGSEGKVSAYGNQLIVNAPPAKIGEVRVLLQQLDTRPRRLLITVESADSSQQNDRGYGVDGSLSAGNAEVQIGRGEVNGRDQVRIIRRSTDSRGGGTQQVQATEGYPALIQVGQSVPLTSTRTGPYGQVYQDTQYRDVTRGFYVTASLSGELVHVSISSQRDRLSNSRPGTIDVQSTDTRVSGRLGEWMTLGGVSEQSSSSDSDVLRRYSTQGREDMSLRIKVEALD
ncbi:secretin N-terminal domain-containing protein [Pseudomonas sp. NCHU5208]|uniref:secretin N-terminal domain-containing protein n=1 Tax=unclassified Pseudomonas TaxID=196821 RepID=UPI003F96AC4B